MGELACGCAMEKIRLRLDYDGSRYDGWQERRDGITIRKKLEDVLTRMEGSDSGKRVEVIGAARTEAGVHACGQTACFLTDSGRSPEEIREYLNRYLPGDIAVRRAEAAEEAFHPVFSARGFRYEYGICTNPFYEVFCRKFRLCSLKVPELEPMEQAAALLAGHHDYRAFTVNPRQKKSTIRTMYQIEIIKDAPGFRICLFGDDFWPHFARLLCKAIIDCGFGMRKPEEMEEFFNGQAHFPGTALPPEGLTLTGICYESIPETARQEERPHRKQV